MSVSLAAASNSIHTRLADLFCFMVSVYFIVHTYMYSTTCVHPIKFLFQPLFTPSLHAQSFLICNFYSDSHYYWISRFSVGSLIACYSIVSCLVRLMALGVWSNHGTYVVETQ